MEKYPHWEVDPSTEPEWFQVLIALARYLRTPEGCPWDREQSAQDFTRYLAEEVEELRKALQSGDAGHSQEEFGDALFSLLAVAAAAEEEGRFRLHDALVGIHEKMIRRHAHVFGDAKADTAEDAVRVWKKVKEQERGIS